MEHPETDAARQAERTLDALRLLVSRREATLVPNDSCFSGFAVIR
jgi:hypothetical protein